MNSGKIQSWNTIMSSKNDDDPFYRLQELQEHQYNPGYWAERHPLGFPLKRSRGLWFLSVIEIFLYIPTFFLTLWFFISKRDDYLIAPLFVFGVFGILAFLRARRFKPARLKETESPAADDTRNPSRKHQKKQRPKRRKDFH